MDWIYGVKLTVPDLNYEAHEAGCLTSVQGLKSDWTSVASDQDCSSYAQALVSSEVNMEAQPLLLQQQQALRGSFAKPGFQSRLM